MCGPSFADRADWKYSFLVASYELPSDKIGEPVLRQKCSVCNGTLVTHQQVTWCTRCQFIPVPSSDPRVAKRLDSGARRGGPDLLF
jgi:hypothetical protein